MFSLCSDCSSENESHVAPAPQDESSSKPDTALREGRILVSKYTITEVGPTCEMCCLD